MLNKVARKVYHLLKRNPAAQSEATARLSFDELTQRKAPNVFGEREEYPELPRPFKRHATGIAMGDYQALTALYTGQKMFVDTRDLSVAPHIMLDGLWEAHVTRALATIIHQDDVFMDIGANFAYYSLIAATRINLQPGKISIHTFEPNPELTNIIYKSFDINGLRDSAKINTIGIGDKKDTLTLYRDESLWGSASFKKEQARSKIAKEFTVPVMTLDAYCKEHDVTKVDVIKLDVEGFEDHAYAGMQQVIKNNPKLRLALEFTFGAYENEPAFFKQLQKDFAYMYYIDPMGELEYIGDYNTLRSKTTDDLVMIILSNQELV